MSVQPTGSVIPTPTIPPGSDQLTDIATIVNSNDPHLAFGGTYESSCGIGTVIGGAFPCAPINMNRGLSEATWVQGVPGTVFTGVACTGPMNLSEMQASALVNIDQRVNRTIQDNLIGGFIPLDEFEVRPASEAGGLADADTVARCEYTGQAVIHIHPSLAEQWMGKEIIRVGRHLETVMGAMVSLNCWLPVDQIAVTGWLTIYKGANRVMDPVYDTYGGEPHNLFFVNVQTPATVFNDCNLAVLITDVPGGSTTPTPGPITVTSTDPDKIPLGDFGGFSFYVLGTNFSPTSVVMINGKAARTLYNSETSLTVLFVPEEFFPGPGSYPVEVIGSDDFVMVEAVPPQKDVSYTVAPVDGQNTGAAMYLRLSEYAGVLNDPQYPDGTSDLLDEDIVSIDWGDGTTSTAPYTRVPRPPLTGQFMTHTYTSDAAGPVTIVADLNDVTCDQGSLTVAYTNTIYYYISQNPQSGGVLVGAPFGVRPIDLAGTVLPADEHFASINWGDGTTQPPPFTVDGGGYATHTYAAAGTFTVSATFINNQSGLTTVPVTAVATQEELDAFNAAYDEQNVDQHQGRDDKRDDKE